MDAYETRRKDWEDLDVTKEELRNLKECLKKEEFRKLLIEYAEEVTDPENRKIYEKEITQLEKQRGVDVTFVNPEPGYVIKTSVNGKRKCFLNISKSDIVARPNSQPFLEEGHRDLQWSIPYILVPPRDDLDKKNVRCTVFDVVFHPDTIYLTSKNARFREIVNNTAMDGVENNFKVKLDRKNLKFPKTSYKGACPSAVIRKPSSEPPTELDIDPEIYQKLIGSYDESREQQSRRTEKIAERPAPPTIYYKNKVTASQETDSRYVTPEFCIKHQSDLELEDFGTCKTSKLNAAIPKRLIVLVDLPLLKSASDATLDVQERSITLKSEKPAKYFLELPLPYYVNPDSGNAKFDSKYKKLTITLPVVPPVASMTDTREDSGVDSDHGSPLPLPSEESTEDSSVTDQPSDFGTKLVEECETMLSATFLDKESDTTEECSDSALRTSSLELDDNFMNPSIKYSLPAFICNIYDNQLAITVNVKNVDPDSIRRRILPSNLGLHVLLVSIGAGFFPQYYSLCIKIDEDSVDPESLMIEPWDNNVVFTITLKRTEDLAKYYVGLSEEFMEERSFPTAASFKNQLNELLCTQDTEATRDPEVKEQKEANESTLVNVRPSQLDTDDETEEQKPRSTARRQNRRHAVTKSRSVSESSGDELTTTISTVGYSKGILKSRRSCDFSCSVSESSADENGMPASSIDCHYDSVHDVNSESDCASFKKTVRFNDVVSRQLFRSNSSILGQRKKNQRKLRNKKRAHERRMSESENSETEEKDKYKNCSKHTLEQEVAEAVKPILNRDRKAEQEKTANIKIKKTRSDEKSSSHKWKSSTTEEEVVENIPAENPAEGAKGTVKAEFKNDLIFDLDI